MFWRIWQPNYTPGFNLSPSPAISNSGHNSDSFFLNDVSRSLHWWIRLVRFSVEHFDVSSFQYGTCLALIAVSTSWQNVWSTTTGSPSSKTAQEQRVNVLKLGLFSYFVLHCDLHNQHSKPFARSRPETDATMRARQNIFIRILKYVWDESGHNKTQML